MLEDIKDAIEKKRDLEVKDMQGATAVGFQYGSVMSCDVFFSAVSKISVHNLPNHPNKGFFIEQFGVF